MKIKTVTITGADNETNPDDLIELSKEFPFAEWGILFSPTRNTDGFGEPRYPSHNWIKALHDATWGKNMKFSAHVCGGYTQEMLTVGDNSLIRKNLADSGFNAMMFSRVQLNFNSSKHNVSDSFYHWLKTKFKSDTTPKCIIQYNKANTEVCKRIMDEKILVHFLYDSSGGRGVVPNYIDPIIEGYFTGYSGGFNPLNLQEVIDKIEDANHPLSQEECWIDVESGVRTDDKLDLVKVHRFLEIAEPYTK